MPKFKVGDKISNGQIEYTVLDIETNSNGDLCYIFKNPYRNSNFRWVTNQVDQMFELVENNDYHKYFVVSHTKESKCVYNRTLEERKKFCKYCSAACEIRIEKPESCDLSKEIDEMVKTYVDKMPDMVINSNGIINWRVFFNEIAKKIAEGAYHQGIIDILKKIKEK